MPAWLGALDEIELAKGTYDILKPQRLAENLADVLPDGTLDWHSLVALDTKELVRHFDAAQIQLEEFLHPAIEVANARWPPQNRRTEYGSGFGSCA